MDQTLVLGVGDTAVNKTDKTPCHRGADMKVGKTNKYMIFDKYLKKKLSRRREWSDEGAILNRSCQGSPL